eukprot:m.311406 g.311406  ORF g.311406 m.311406 type:complete len:241 (+) comp68274_c0_seq1:109-831(+)
MNESPDTYSPLVFMAFFTLTLVRHGETEANQRRILQGQKDTELSETGIKQAKALAIHLRSENFSHVYSSDLQRAMKTAQIAVDGSGKTICKDNRLRERGFGVLEGQKTRVFHQAARRADRGAFEYTPEGGETVPKLKDRAKAFFADLCSGLFECGEQKSCDHPSQSLGNVLVVGHGGSLRILILHLVEDCHCDLSNFLEGGSHQLGISPNAGISKFQVRLEESTGIPVVTCLVLYNNEHL